MKIFGRIAVILLIVLVVAGVLAYADGASLPVNHSVSVTGTVQAPPEKVFAIIANVANGVPGVPPSSPSPSSHRTTIATIGLKTSATARR